jgi:hypothetical protein
MKINKMQEMREKMMEQSQKALEEAEAKMMQRVTRE